MDFLPPISLASWVAMGVELPILLALFKLRREPRSPDIP